MTARTKPELEAEVASTLPDNTTGLITPAAHRGLLADLIDSAPIARRGTVYRHAALTADDTGSAAHDLGAVPDRVEFFAECAGAQAGYAVGDRIYIPAAGAVWADATSVGFVLRGWRITPKSGGAAVEPDADSWTAVLIPWLHSPRP